MSEETYYVKIRGRVLGPFLPDRLIEMVKQGKLSRVHMLSTDNDHWQKASAFPELFQAAAVSSRTTEAVASPITAEPDTPTLELGEVWHYAINGESKGPVAQTTIRELIGMGQLKETDLIWREGMQEWKPASSVPIFNSFFLPTNNVTDHAVSENQNKTVSSDLGQIKQKYIQQLPWVMLIVVNLYLTAVGQFFVFITGLVQGGKQSDPVLITSGLVALVYTAFFGVTAYYLEKSVDWLRRVWQTVGYMLIMLWVLIIIAVIYTFTITQL
jgi:hypothetical protein